MAARNPDSMSNAQGEFTPSKPRDEPIETHGHKPGVKSSPADHAPEFSAQTLPAGTAPKSSTFTPNVQSEIPGQAYNENVERSHGKESVRTDPLSTLPGATSADVHMGLGHPGQGQTSTEVKHASKKHTAGLKGAGATGALEGSGLGAEDDHPRGPIAGHNVSLDGAESMQPASAEEVAAESGKAK